MKKYLMNLAALMLTLTAITLTSCVHTNDPDNLATPDASTPNTATPEPGTHVETLTIAFPDQEQTRVAIDENSLLLTGWEEGDEVKVYNVDKPNQVVEASRSITFTCTDPVAGTFTGNLPNGKTLADYNLAVYGHNLSDLDSDISVECRFVSTNLKDVIILSGLIENGSCTMTISNNVIKVTNNYTPIECAWRTSYNDYYYIPKLSFDYDNNLAPKGRCLISDFNSAKFTIPTGVSYICYCPTFFDIASHGIFDENGDDIVPYKNFGSNGIVGKLFKKTLVLPIAMWETELTLGRNDPRIVTISIETGVDISSYTEDATHKPLNAAGNLWEVEDGDVLRIQTSMNRIIGHNAFFYSSTSLPYGLFEGYNRVAEITGLEHLDMREVTDMRNMFKNCNELFRLDLSSFNTGKVTDMSGMFYGCSELPWNATIANLNTANVTNMRNMFRDCASFVHVDLSSFNTSQVTDMYSMFQGCGLLYSVNLTNFNTANVTDLSDMFHDCNWLQTLDLSSFNTANVKDMSNMFRSCNRLSSITFGNNFSMEKVWQTYGMFLDCGAYLGDGNKCVLYGLSGKPEIQTEMQNSTGWDDARMEFANN